MKTFVVIVFLILSVFHYQLIIIENQQTLLFFMEQLLPSLFLLCVLIQMLPMPSSSKRNRFLNIFFHMDTASFFILLKAILLGNPAGSYMIYTLYQQHKLTRQQARRLIYCSSIPSISFMVMTLPFMTSQQTAFFILLIHLLSICVLLIITRSIEIRVDYDAQGVSLYQAIQFALHTMALILAYLMIAGAGKSLLLVYFPSFEVFIELFSEFASGCQYASQQSHVFLFLLISIGFGGGCAHLQIMSGCNDIQLSYWRYLVFRMIHVVFNIVLYGLFLGIFFLIF